MKSAEAARKASRLLGSQAEMARQLNVKPPTVNQWCSGERQCHRSAHFRLKRLPMVLSVVANCALRFPGHRFKALLVGLVQPPVPSGSAKQYPIV